MGQFLNIEISEAIIEYLQVFPYATPKKLIKEIYPIFRNRYPGDTFRRLLHRNLKRLKNEKSIVEHPFRPFYCFPDTEWVLDGDLVFALKRDYFHSFFNQEYRDPKIIDASAKPPEKCSYTFIEYLAKKRKESGLE